VIGAARLLCGLAAGLAFLPGAVRAQDVAAQCQVPAELATLEDPLPRLASRLGDRPLSVTVIGSGSSAGAGTSGASRAYPQVLQRELERRLGTPVVVDSIARRGATAADMLEIIRRNVVPRRPALVIWQTGTADAVRGVDINTFGDALEKGLDALHERGIDVVLMDMQYGPQTDSLLKLRPYRNYMLWAARGRDVPLFRRHDVMSYWAERGVVELSATTRPDQVKAADFVHDCLGRLLAAGIQAAVRQAQPK
jgi:hypothetical protein